MRQIYLILVLLLTLTGVVSAQTPVSLQPILSSQHGVQLEIPRDWDTVFFEEDGVVISETEDVFMAIYFTDALNRRGYTSLIPAELNQQIAADNDFADQEQQIIETNGQFRNVLTHTDGVLVAEAFGTEGIISIDVRTGDVDAVLDTLLAMIDGLAPYEQSIRVENYTSSWRIITTELIAKGYVREGQIIQTAPIIEFSGEGNQYMPIAEDEIVQDIIVGATLALQSGAGEVYETCGLMSRIISDDVNGVSNFLEVGVDSDVDAYIFDRFGAGDDGATLNYGTISDPTEEAYIVYKVDGGLANVFVNGQLVFANLLIQEREGHFGASFVGRTPDSACTITDVWLYEMGSDCTLTVSDDRETFFSPEETEFALGEVLADTTVAIDAYYLDADMTPWWRTRDDARWMRGDDVIVDGACGAVSFVNNLNDVN